MKTLLPGLKRRTTRLTIGTITALVGFLNLFVYATPLQIVFLGDLLPALAGIVLGSSLAVAALRSANDEDAEPEAGLERPQHTTEEDSSRVVTPDGSVEKTAKLALGYRVPVGLAGIGVALLHFLFPGAVLF